MKTKLQGVRVIEIPPFRAVSSGQRTWDELFGEGSSFDQWIGAHQQLIKNVAPYDAADFLLHEEDDINQSVWIWAVKDGVTEADVAPYELIEYEGGMFAVATADENDEKDLNKVVSGMLEWIKKSGVFERDERPGHRGMGHMVGCGAIQKALGIAQQEIFLPVKLKEAK